MAYVIDTFNIFSIDSYKLNEEKRNAENEERNIVYWNIYDILMKRENIWLSINMKKKSIIM